MSDGNQLNLGVLLALLWDLVYAGSTVTCLSLCELQLPFVLASMVVQSPTSTQSSVRKPTKADFSFGSCGGTQQNCQPCLHVSHCFWVLDSGLTGTLPTLTRNMCCTHALLQCTSCCHEVVYRPPCVSRGGGLLVYLAVVNFSVSEMLLRATMFRENSSMESY